MVALQSLSGLTSQQQIAADAIEGWLRGDRHELTVSGYAGTGKSTVLSYMYPALRDAGTLFVAPSMKAAQVLNDKGRTLGYDIQATTIHSAIYLFTGTVETPLGHELPTFDGRDGFSNSLPFAPRRMVIDEASMPDSATVRELRSKELPLLFVGDGFQLPPIKDDPHLMDCADVTLTEVHRQAADSGILRLATKIRQHECGFSFDDESHDVTIKRMSRPRAIATYAQEVGVDQIIVAYNKTRHEINTWSRKLRGHKQILEVGERIICRFNDRKRYIFNGQQFTVLSINNETADAYICDLEMDGGLKRSQVPVQKLGLGNPEYKTSERRPGTVDFDYGYAITAHASQGSGFSNVLVVDQPCRAWNMARWRYTGTTRAQNHLVVAVR